MSRLNPVIHERARLGIVSALAAREAASFAELKALLDMTDGNLSVHLRTLEAAGYVSIDKTFVDRKPRSTARLSRKGRLAFEHYVEVLEEIVKGR
ncbi:MAG TPA: transcriptional regulator [Planctomycetota bacterium]